MVHTGYCGLHEMKRHSAVLMCPKPAKRTYSSARWLHVVAGKLFADRALGSQFIGHQVRLAVGNLDGGFRGAPWHSRRQHETSGYRHHGRTLQLPQIDGGDRST